MPRFTEKPPGDNAFINGGFFVLHPAVLDRIDGDDTPWETEPLESLAHDGELRASATPDSGSRWIRCATEPPGGSVVFGRRALEGVERLSIAFM